MGDKDFSKPQNDLKITRKKDGLGGVEWGESSNPQDFEIYSTGKGWAASPVGWSVDWL